MTPYYVTTEGLFTATDEPMLGTQWPRVGSVRVYSATEVEALLLELRSALTNARSFAAQVPNTMGLTVKWCSDAIKRIDDIVGDDIA